MKDIIPESYYNARVVSRTGEDGTHKARWGKSSNGNTQVLMYFQVVEGPWSGEVIPWFGFFTKAAGKRTVESLRYCGFKGDDLFDLDRQDLDQMVSIQVEHNEYDDKVYPRVAFVNAVGGGVMKMKAPMDAGSLRAFAATMKKKIALVPAHEGAKAPEPAREPARGDAPGETDPRAGDNVEDDWGPPPSDDDIPF